MPFRFNNNVCIVFFIIFILYLICTFNNDIEPFYLWNIPTRWNRPIYDIRDYKKNSWYFIHNGKLYDSKYIDINKYQELYNYLPYYNNGMIYMANGKYSYNTFAKHFNMPILYNTPYNSIDWIGLVNNGIINTNI